MEKMSTPTWQCAGNKLVLEGLQEERPMQKSFSCPVGYKLLLNSGELAGSQSSAPGQGCKV